MKEEMISHLWKLQYFDKKSIVSSKGEEIKILSTGKENKNAGPDFFNAKIEIHKQLWAGNVEIHVKSSDWYVHGHENDKNYDSVILHVVWENDVSVYRKDNTPIPTLELKNFINKDIITNYRKLFSASKKWINCENDIVSIDTFLLNNWLERLYIERLEDKSKLIQKLLTDSKNDWETVLFKLLAKNFGLKVNADAFLDLANKLDFNIIRKEQSNLENLEALFFGEGHFLNETVEDAYYKHLQKEYAYLKAKYKLTDTFNVQFQFFRLRPNNFPTIRLAQLAALYNKHQNLFSKILSTNKLSDFYELFDVSVSEYWKTHYSFTSTSKKSAKKVTKNFVDLLLINTIIPLKFMYLKHIDKLSEEKLLQTVQEIKSEKNSILDKFNTLKIIPKNAFESQALLQLKNEYCSKQRCLQCAIGNSILNNV